MRNFLATAALATAMVLPMAAQAATVNQMIGLNENVGENAIVTAADNTATFNFTATEELRVGPIVLTGNGLFPDVDAITISLAPSGANTGFTTFTFTPQQFGTAALNIASNLTLLAGDTFSVIFDGAVANNVDVDLSFTTAPVPLPAAGGFLLAAMVAGGFAGRRRKDKKA